MPTWSKFQISGKTNFVVMVSNDTERTTLDILFVGKGKLAKFGDACTCIVRML